MSSSKARKSSRTRRAGASASEALQASVLGSLGAAVALGTLAGIDAAGGVLVDHPGNPTGRPLVALATVALGAAAVGRAVALLFIDGDPARPLIVGLIQGPADGNLEIRAAPAEDRETPLEARVDGERVVISADKEIVLTCGKASITLTRAGKVLIRGAYLLNRSSGVNRIKGGSVQIN